MALNVNKVHNISKSRIIFKKRKLVDFGLSNPFKCITYFIHKPFSGASGWDLKTPTKGNKLKLNQAIVSSEYNLSRKCVQKPEMNLNLYEVWWEMYDKLRWTRRFSSDDLQFTKGFDAKNSNIEGSYYFSGNGQNDNAKSALLSNNFTAIFF